MITLRCVRPMADCLMEENGKILCRIPKKYCKKYRNKGVVTPKCFVIVKNAVDDKAKLRRDKRAKEPQMRCTMADTCSQPSGDDFYRCYAGIPHDHVIECDTGHTCPRFDGYDGPSITCELARLSIRPVVFTEPPKQMRRPIHLADSAVRLCTCGARKINELDARNDNWTNNIDFVTCKNCLRTLSDDKCSKCHNSKRCQVLLGNSYSPDGPCDWIPSRFHKLKTEE